MKYQHFNCYIFLYNGWMRGPGTPCNHTPSWQWTKDLWYYSFGLCPHSGRSLHLKQHPGDRGSSGHCISTFSSHKREGKGTQIYPTDHNLLSHRNLPFFFFFFLFPVKKGSIFQYLPNFLDTFVVCGQSSPFLSLLSPRVRITHGKPWELLEHVSSRWNFIWKKSMILSEYHQHYSLYY